MELVRRHLVSSRAEARRVIDAGLVRLEAVTSPKPSTMVSPQDALHVVSPPDQFVSRAGQKLDAALEAFEIDVTDMSCIDVGASTGGFTDCLLQRGVSRVVALDVGHGQLNWKIRNNDRVHVVERTNIRTTDPGSVDGPFEVVVADLSFISLRTVSDALVSMGTDEAHWILLVKPQFEAGRERVGKGGIVRVSAVRYDVLNAVLGHFAEHEMRCLGLMRSPITGARGNIEYLAWFRRTTGSVDDEDIKSLIEGVRE